MMRLYLSSFHLGHEPDHLVNMVGDNKRAAVIVNASDACTSEIRDQQRDTQFHNLSSLGFQPDELDLRHYRGKADDLEKRLADYGMVWVKGGNVFVLRDAFKQSGFDHIMTSMLQSDRIVYAGYSAGACVMAPTLNGLHLCDDPKELSQDEKQITWSGLGLIDYSILPHYKSNHHESERIDDVVSYMQDNALPFRTLHDGEAIVINGQNVKLVGQVPDFLG